MTSSPDCQREPFFLESSGRRLFAVFHPPAAEPRRKGGVVFFAPFAEELNRTRRTATLLAEALAAAGVGTLVFDYSCTGDSAGDFGHARWEDWVEDGATAIAWLADRLDGPVTAVGLRLGAAIALHSADQCRDRIGGIVLWQPVTSGRNMVTQFLRIRIASALGDTGQRETTAALRERFAAGETLEIGGYDLAPHLVTSLDSISLADGVPLADVPTAWFEVAAGDDGGLMPASQAVIDRWRGTNREITASAVSGEPFWSTVEMTTAPALVDATVAAITGTHV